MSLRQWRPPVNQHAWPGVSLHIPVVRPTGIIAQRAFAGGISSLSSYETLKDSLVKICRFVSTYGIFECFLAQ
jgi:hypothetical protein